MEINAIHIYLFLTPISAITLDNAILIDPEMGDSQSAADSDGILDPGQHVRERYGLAMTAVLIVRVHFFVDCPPRYHRYLGV